MDISFLSEKLNIVNKKTLRQILANKKLCSELAKRPVISEKDLIEMYDIPLSYLKGLKRRKDISYFNSKGQLNVSEQGTKYYYFLDDVQNLMSHNINYNQSFVFRYNLMNKVVLGLAKKLISEKETDMLTMLFKDNMSLDEISEKLTISNTRTLQLLNKASNRIIYRINELEKMYATFFDALSLKTELDLLKKQNTNLYNKFLKSQENKSEQELKFNTHMQHFIKYGYDIKDLNKKLYDFELSVRAINCLRFGDIEILDDLLFCKKNDLIKFRNMGRKTVVEICDWLEDKYNWRLQ